MLVLRSPLEPLFPKSTKFGKSQLQINPVPHCSTICKSPKFWGARISEVYYANTRSDAQKIDFSDAMIYEELNKTIKDRKIPMHQMMRNEALKAFDLWDKKEDKVKY